MISICKFNLLTDVVLLMNIWSLDPENKDFEVSWNTPTRILIGITWFMFTVLQLCISLIIADDLRWLATVQHENRGHFLK